MAAITNRRAFLEEMVQKYRDDFEKGQNEESILSSIAALTYMKEKTFEREKALEKEKLLFPSTGLFAAKMREDLEELPSKIGISYQYATPHKDIDSIKIKQDAPTSIVTMFNTIDTFLKNTKTALDLAEIPADKNIEFSIEDFSLKNIFQKISNFIKDMHTLDGNSKDGIKEAQREFAAKTLKDAVTNLAISVELKSAYYSPEQDMNTVLDVVKNLHDRKLLPEDVESVFSKFNPQTADYEFVGDAERYVPYVVVKGYNRLVEFVNKKLDSNLPDSNKLMDDRFQKLASEYDINASQSNLSSLSRSELQMDIFAYAITKSSITLSYINSSLNSIDDKINKEPVILNDFAKVMESLDETRERVLHSMKLIQDDIRNNFPSVRKLEKALLAVVSTKENNYDLIVNSLMEGKLFETDTKIEITDKQRLELDILHDRYGDQVANMQKESNSPFTSSSVDFLEMFYKKLPNFIENIKGIEQETDKLIKEIVDSSSLTKRDIAGDRFITTKAIEVSL